MSWIKQLAVKAEAALERIDTEAAAVLKKDKVSPLPITVSSLEHKRSSSYNQPTCETLSTVNREPRSWSFSAQNSVNSSPKDFKSRKRNMDASDDKSKFEKNSCDLNLHSRQSSSSSFGSSYMPGSNGESPALYRREIDTSVDSGHVGSFGVVDSQQNTFRSSASSSVSTNYSEGPTKQNVFDVNTTSMNESDMLRKEVTSLSQEMQQVLRRAKDAESETERIKSELSALVDHKKDAEVLLLESHQRESKLQNELKCAMHLSENGAVSNDENQRLMTETTESNNIEFEELQALKDKYQAANNNLQNEKKSSNKLKETFSIRISEMDEMQKRLRNELDIFQQQYESERQTTYSHSLKILSLKSELDDCLKEFDDYKAKAARILAEKQNLFDTFMQKNGEELPLSSDAFCQQEMAQLKNERDLLQDELERCGKMIHKLRTEMTESQLSAQKELDSSLHQLNKVKENLSSRQDTLLIAEEQKVRAELELQKIQEESSSTNHTLNKRVQERDEEIQKLQKQIAHKISSSVGTYELENRIHSLTEALILKQNNIETLSTEKHTLRIQCEKLQEQYAEAQKLLNTDVKIYVEDSQHRQPSFMTESPFDGGVTRGVKKAYSGVDKFSIRLGTFLRRYPVARLFILMYMGLLHVWVMIVLFTYTPEVHP